MRIFMFAHQYADLLKGWLAAAHHPGIAQVRTCAEIQELADMYSHRPGYDPAWAF